MFCVESNRNNKSLWKLTNKFPRSDDEQSMFDEEVNRVKKLAMEEFQLDDWIARMEEFSNLNPVPLDRADKYVTSQNLAPLLSEESVVLAIATPTDTTLKRSLHLDDHSFTLVPPKPKKSKETTKESKDSQQPLKETLGPSKESQEPLPKEPQQPRVFLLKLGEEMRQLPLMPFPSLLERCTSDFSADALNNGLVRQESDGLSQLLAAASGEAAAASHSNDSRIAAEALLSMEPSLTRHESFGIMDKTEPLPPLSTDAMQAKSPSANEEDKPSAKNESTVQDENAKPFQYPWLKGKSTSKSKYAPKRATRGLLGDSDSEDEEPSKQPPVTLPKEKSESPKKAHRSLLWGSGDPASPHPEARIMKQISADLPPLPCGLHECTSLVLS